MIRPCSIIWSSHLNPMWRGLSVLSILLKKKNWGSEKWNNLLKDTLGISSSQDVNPISMISMFVKNMSLEYYPLYNFNRKKACFKMSHTLLKFVFMPQSVTVFIFISLYICIISISLCPNHSRFPLFLPRIYI